MSNAEKYFTHDGYVLVSKANADYAYGTITLVRLREIMEAFNDELRKQGTWRRFTLEKGRIR